MQESVKGRGRDRKQEKHGQGERERETVTRLGHGIPRNRKVLIGGKVRDRTLEALYEDFLLSTLGERKGRNAAGSIYSATREAVPNRIQTRVDVAIFSFFRLSLFLASQFVFLVSACLF